MTQASGLPFSFPVKVGHVSTNPLNVHVCADEKERSALARLWGVVALEAFEAEVELTRWKRDGVRAKGRVRASVVQESVVSLEPVASRIDERLDAVFVPEGSRLARVDMTDSGEIQVDPDGPDMPETFAGDAIDVGAIVAEFAALALDPYPRKPGESYAPNGAPEDPDPEEVSPFAVLKDLKNDDG